jgi:RNA polymerase sigma factor (sigma-70 family)
MTSLDGDASDQPSIERFEDFLKNVRQKMAQQSPLSEKCRCGDASRSDAKEPCSSAESHVRPVDEASLSQLSIGGVFRIYWQIVHRMADRCSPQHAEDIAGKTLYEATTNWGRADQAFRGTSRAQFWSWMKKVFWHNVFDARKVDQTQRGRMHRETISLDLTDPEGDRLFTPTDVSHDTPSGMVSQREQILAVIEKLPSSQREVASLQFIGALTSVEIAERRGVTDVEVEVLLSKATRNLKKHLEFD